MNAHFLKVVCLTFEECLTKVPRKVSERMSPEDCHSSLDQTYQQQIFSNQSTDILDILFEILKVKVFRIFYMRGRCPFKCFGVCTVWISGSSLFILPLRDCACSKTLRTSHDQRANQSQHLFLCDLRQEEFALSQIILIFLKLSII